MPQTTNVLDGGIAFSEWLPATNVDHNGDGSTGTTRNDSYIEISNISGGPIDISGYNLWTFNTGLNVQALFHTVPAATTLNAGETYTVVSASPSGGGTPTGFGSGTAVIGNFQIDASNVNMFLVDAAGSNYIVLGTAGGASFLSGDITQAGLSSANQVGIDVVVEGSETLLNSWQRQPDGEDGFVEDAPSPGANNLCFAAGTLITTPEGARAVESLKIGDLVTTTAGRNVPVKWLGVQTLSKRSMGERMQPVLIAAGALGDGLPHSDLTVTADHGMVFPSSSKAVGETKNDGYVINASALINGTTIDWVPMDELDDSFVVYHIETEAHDVILANGTAAETFVDVAGRAAFDNYQEYLDLYGTERIIPEMRTDRITAQRLLPEAIKTRLGISAKQMDWDQILTA